MGTGSRTNGFKDTYVLSGLTGYILFFPLFCYYSVSGGGSHLEVLRLCGVVIDYGLHTISGLDRRKEKKKKKKTVGSQPITRKMISS